MMNEQIKNYDESHLVTPKQRRQTNSRRSNAKFEAIREQLRAMALEKGAGSQLPTIRELCTLFNTSSVTLTAALDLLEAEHILARKERRGIFVADNIRQGTIHIVFNMSALTDVSISPFWSLLWGHLIQETEQRASTKNEKYQFHFLCRPFGLSLSDDYVALLNSPSVGGCLLIGLNARRMDHTRLLQVPHVVLAGGGDIMIHDDGLEKMRLAVHKLIDVGCQRLGIWQSFHTSATNSVLFAPESDASHMKNLLSTLNVPFYPELFRTMPALPSSERNLTFQEQGYLLAKEVFGSPHGHRPDGLYISDDMMTSGALAAFEELEIRPGRDVQIVSHANKNSPMLFASAKKLTTVEYDPADYVRAMFAQLDGAMLNGYTPEERSIKIQPRLRG